MRIIGGRDYYDSAMAYGHDTHTTYVRGSGLLHGSDAEDLGIERAEHVVSLLAPGRDRAEYLFDVVNNAFTSATLRGVHFQHNYTTVIACGWRRQGIRLAAWRHEPGDGTVQYAWSRSRLDAWAAEHGLRAAPLRTTAELDAWFEPTPVSNAVLDAMIARRWTVLVHDPRACWYESGHGAWEVDQPVLKEVEFFRAVPPNVMFQEIDMWVGGRLASGGAEMLEISDEVRLAKHGMDRTSFRKPKRGR